MPLTRAKKTEKVTTLASELEHSTSAIIGTFKALTASKDFDLRKTVRDAGGSYHVVKNKLAARAAEGTKIEAALQGLKGVSSVAYTSGDKIADAKAAGAEFAGGEELVEKIQKEGWTAFDALIATPDMMKSVGRLGKVLGPKGLMPNPKTGTVTTDVVAAIREIKAGKVEFRTDKTALVHVPVGKLSFEPQKLVDNAMTVISSVLKAKPSAAKGKYVKGITLSSTMGPGIQLDAAVMEAAGKA